VFDAEVQTALQKYTCWGILGKSGRALVGSRAVGYQYLAALLVKLYLLSHGAFAAQPHYLLLCMRWETPHQRLVDWKSVDLAGSKSLKLGVAPRIDALPYR
jgi:hypothetical protein